jgi:ATP-dependent DNA helicase PIF1
MTYSFEFLSHHNSVKWNFTLKRDNPQLDFDYHPVDTTRFSEEQSLAYNIILNHAHRKSTDPLLLIVTGEAGTGKSYLINAVRNYLKRRCVVTATTGKAAFNINGVTIHSLLKLPVLPTSHKDLSGQCLVALQESLVDAEYIIIDEYSMLCQNTMGWIDRRCRQATGLKQDIFGGK